jgi:glycosyltransferase involved in cell wall biosynthesis
MTAFVQGRHQYLVPVTDDRGPEGLGRAQTFDWPGSVWELSPPALHDAPIDVVILQRPWEEDLTEQWTGRRPGRDIPAVYLEHNTPKGDVPDTRHPMADREDLVLCHVTHCNELFWDNGSTRTVVIEHGIVDPGYRYRGDLARAAVVVNEPVRRNRTVGTDLLPRFAEATPLDVFGMRTEGLAEHLVLPPDRCRSYELPQARMHDELARRRMYVHPIRWTSLGLSLLEAMHLGMPVIALASTEAAEAVPPDAGVISTRVDTLVEAAAHYLAEPEAAAEAGHRARQAALARYGLKRFLDDWESLLEEVSS